MTVEQLRHFLDQQGPGYEPDLAPRRAYRAGYDSTTTGADPRGAAVPPEFAAFGAWWQLGRADRIQGEMPLYDTEPSSWKGPLLAAGLALGGIGLLVAFSKRSSPASRKPVGMGGRSVA